MKAIGHWLTTWWTARLKPLQRKVLVLCASALAGLALFFGFSGDQDRDAVAAALRNPLSVFAARSPGARVGGALYQTKPRLASARRTRPLAPGLVPSERVLPTIRVRPPAALGGAPLIEAPPELALLGRPDDLFGLPGVPVLGEAPGFDVPGFAFGDGPGFAAEPQNPPNPPQSPSQPGSSVPESPGPAVPEPATWLMMLLGLGAIGLALRRREGRAVPDRR